MTSYVLYVFKGESPPEATRSNDLDELLERTSKLGDDKRVNGFEIWDETRTIIVASHVYPR